MEKKISVWKTLEGMEVGESKPFPAEKIRSVKVTASDYGFVSGRKYSVRKDVENRQIIVKREA